MTRFAGVLFVGLVVMACGPRVAPAAQNPSAASPTRTQLPASTPTPTSTQAQDGITASVTCSGGPGAAMTVIAGAFLYEVSDPVRPRLVCRSANTVLHLIDNKAVAYTAVVGSRVVIIRRDLTNGAESQVAQLQVEPRPYYYGGVGWTWDGSLEVYSTSVPRADGRALVSVHLWSSGADHLLFTVDAGPGGLESRWSPRGILAFSPDHAYLAISDFPFYIYGENLRMFSVANVTQTFVVAGSSWGGTWAGNDRFIWATTASAGSLMQWTPSGGAKLLRSEPWWGPASSSDGRWVAATLVTDMSNPRVQIAPVSGGAALTTGPGSSPTFVFPTLVWYAEEGPDTSGSYQCLEPCAHPTTPNGTVRAFDVTNGTDRVVTFRVGEAPKTSDGYTICCLASG